MSVFNKNRDKVNRFESFVKTYERYMFAIARRILHDEQLAEDACQETVIKLWQRFDSLSFTNEKAQRGFIGMLTKHTSINILNKNKREIPVDFLEAENYLRGPC